MRGVTSSALACIAAGALLTGLSDGRAGHAAPARAAVATATPTVASTPAPSPTPLPAGATVLRLRVVDDLNASGTADAGEPGLSGWNITYTCGDAIARAPVTDADGRSTVVLAPYQGKATACPALERQFGWLPTSPRALRVDVPAGETRDVTFLVRNLGPDVMEVRGEAIVAGVPAMGAVFGTTPPFSGCSESYVEGSNVYVLAVVFVVGAGGRAGCPSAGDAVSITEDGEAQAAVAYAPGAKQSQTFVAGGDSMRFYSHDIDAARIDGVDCSAIATLGGPLPPGSVRVFVLSEQARPGCGAPGRLVRLYRAGRPLDPLIEWRAGDVTGQLPEFVESRRIIVVPDAGAGVPPTGPERSVASVMLALAAAGLAALGAGMALRRRAC